MEEVRQPPALDGEVADQGLEDAELARFAITVVVAVLGAGLARLALGGFT